MSKGENMVERDLKARLEAQWDGPILHPSKPMPWAQRDEWGTVVKAGYELPALSQPNDEGEGK